MNKFSKLLWSEGLFIKPHHFQQQDTYHENRSSYLTHLINPYMWGLNHIAVNESALENNKVIIQELEFVFPDGTIVNAPNNDPCPLTLELTEQDTQKSEIILEIVLPSIQPFVSNIEDESHKQIVRYKSKHTDVKDLYANSSEASLDFVIHQTYLKIYSENQQVNDSVISVPILKLHKINSSGSFVIDKNFIPSIISWGASPKLSDMLNSLLDILQAKSNALYNYHREPVKNLIEFRSSDVASFWLLNIVNQHYARLYHIKSNHQFASERLYQELLSLVGCLMTFSSLYNLNDLLPYNHLAPAECFIKIYQFIRDLISTVISSKTISIILNEYKPSFWSGDLDSEKIDEDTIFYLGIKSSMNVSELCDNVNTCFKIGSSDDVEKMVMSAMPGIQLKYLAQIPAEISIKPSYVYFEMDKKNYLYERMLKSKNLNLYIPGGFDDISLELIALTS